MDWENKQILVQRQLQRITGEGLIFSELKSESSKRVIALGSLSIKKLFDHREILREYRLFAGDHWKKNDLVFPSTIGTPMEPRNLYSHFIRIIKEIGLPKIRFHDLRHTAATMMLLRGGHPKIIQEQLGHSSITQTLDIYSHIIPSMQREIAEIIDSNF